MRSIICFCLGIFCCFQSYGNTDSTKILQFQLMPEKLIPAFTADARTHRLQLLKRTQGTEFYGSMGTQFPIINAKGFNKILQVSLAGSTYLTLERYVKHGSVLNVDFFVDLLFDLELSKQWYLRGGLGHTSQHIADDALIAGITPKNYVKDYGQLFSIHRLLQNRLMFYEGFYYFDNFKIGETMPIDWSKKIMLQAGAEIQVLQWNKIYALYVAGDVKFRQEFNFGTTQNLQLGYVISKTQSKNIRLAYNYLSGYDERGQFYNKKVNLHTVGIYLEL